MTLPVKPMGGALAEKWEEVENHTYSVKSTRGSFCQCSSLTTFTVCSQLFSHCSEAFAAYVWTVAHRSSTVPWDSPVEILEWFVISSSGSFQLRDQMASLGLLYQADSLPEPLGSPTLPSTLQLILSSAYLLGCDHWSVLVTPFSRALLILCSTLKNVLLFQLSN